MPHACPGSGKESSVCERGAGAYNTEATEIRNMTQARDYVQSIRADVLSNKTILGEPR